MLSNLLFYLLLIMHPNIFFSQLINHLIKPQIFIVVFAAFCFSSFFIIQTLGRPFHHLQPFFPFPIGSVVLKLFYEPQDQTRYPLNQHLNFHSDQEPDLI